MTTELADKPRGLRERKKLQAQRAIRSAALQLFATEGYELVTVEQIAAAADVSRTTFFNYFPSKEAVITEPDPEALAAQRALCAGRPPGEPLWSALSAVVLGGLRLHEASIRAQKQLKASSPSMASIMHRASERTIDDLREWAESHAPDAQRQHTRLQLNVAIAAMATVFEQWEPDRPFREFVSLAEEYLALMGQAFDELTGPPSDAAQPTTE